MHVAAILWSSDDRQCLGPRTWKNAAWVWQLPCPKLSECHCSMAARLNNSMLILLALARSWQMGQLAKFDMLGLQKQKLPGASCTADASDAVTIVAYARGPPLLPVTACRSKCKQSRMPGRANFGSPDVKPKNFFEGNTSTCTASLGYQPSVTKSAGALC